MVYTKKKAIRKFAKKPFRKVLSAGKKRYFYSKGTPKLGAIVRDVAYLKSQINAEHKHIDTTIGASALATYTAQTAVQGVPVILPLNLPEKGLNNYNRVGNQIIVTNITCKYRISFTNNSDKFASRVMRARIIWAKNANDVPGVANLLMQDPNDNYTPLSFVNEQEYRKYIWMKSLDVTKKYVNNHLYSLSGTIDTVGTSLRDQAQFYPWKKWTGRIKTEFATGSDVNTSCTINKPYLFITSDAQEDGLGGVYDPAYLSGTIRITYIDN